MPTTNASGCHFSIYHGGNFVTQTILLEDAIRYTMREFAIPPTARMTCDFDLTTDEFCYGVYYPDFDVAILWREPRKPQTKESSQ